MRLVPSESVQFSPPFLVQFQTAVDTCPTYAFSPDHVDLRSVKLQVETGQQLRRWTSSVDIRSPPLHLYERLIFAEG